MANPLPESAAVENAFRVLNKLIQKKLPVGEQEAAAAALVLLKSFLSDVHAVAVMAKRQQGLER
jgi:hypothetical protein